jgi:activator of HSP90 ATPase
MSDRANSATVTRASTRRQLVAAGVLGLGGIITRPAIWGYAMPQASQQIPTTNQRRTSLHQEIDLKASTERIYEVLLDSKQFGAATGLPAQIDPIEGGPFKTFGGLIVGRNVELVSNERIVQAWRPTHWDSGIYSIVRFQLKPQASGAFVILDHTGFPEGEYDHLNEGWPTRYWEPLKKFLAS